MQEADSMRNPRLAQAASESWRELPFRGPRLPNMPVLLQHRIQFARHTVQLLSKARETERREVSERVTANKRRKLAQAPVDDNCLTVVGCWISPRFPREIRKRISQDLLPRAFASSQEAFAGDKAAQWREALRVQQTPIFLDDQPGC